jgi:hypothetical protein
VLQDGGGGAGRPRRESTLKEGAGQRRESGTAGGEGHEGGRGGWKKKVVKSRAAGEGGSDGGDAVLLYHCSEGTNRRRIPAGTGMPGAAAAPCMHSIVPVAVPDLLGPTRSPAGTAFGGALARLAGSEDGGEEGGVGFPPPGAPPPHPCRHCWLGPCSRNSDPAEASLASILRCTRLVECRCANIVKLLPRPAYGCVARAETTTRDAGLHSSGWLMLIMRMLMLMLVSGPAVGSSGASPSGMVWRCITSDESLEQPGTCNSAHRPPDTGHGTMPGGERVALCCTTGIVAGVIPGCTGRVKVASETPPRLEHTMPAHATGSWIWQRVVGWQLAGSRLSAQDTLPSRGRCPQRRPI